MFVPRIQKVTHVKEFIFPEAEGNTDIEGTYFLYSGNKQWMKISFSGPFLGGGEI